MTRLIDADEIIIPCMETTTDDYRVQSMIEEQPTIDAIPISWIEERIKNVQDAGLSSTARMWIELVDSYKRERNKDGK